MYLACNQIIYSISSTILVRHKIGYKLPTIYQALLVAKQMKKSQVTYIR